LKSNGGGALVQMNSLASIKNFPQFTTYSAAKAASYSVTQALGVSLREQGSTVLSIHAGPIDTNMAKEAGLENAEPAELVGEAVVEGLKRGQFHSFPDSMAKQFGEAYESYAKNVIETELVEA